MTETKPAHPIAIEAISVAPRTKPSNYPEPFLSRMAGRVKRPLGDLFGLKNFGVNLTTLAPGGQSALMHRHSKQDEFIFILEGEPIALCMDHFTSPRLSGFAGASILLGLPASSTISQRLFIGRNQRDGLYAERLRQFE